MVFKVVAGFIRKGERFLLVRRPFGKKRGGLWEFPGGKVEDGETLEEALKRELKEELNLDVVVKEKLASVRHRYPEVEVELHLIEVKACEEPELKEAIEKRWVIFEEADKLELCDADRKVLEQIKTCKK